MKENTLKNKKIKTLILLDRDGTLIYDDKYHLGRTNDWKSKIKIIPKVIEGLKILKKINASIYIITNQPGVAIKEFKLLTKKRAEKVCEEVINQLNSKGARVDGYFLCPHASKSYVKRKKEKTFNKSLVCNCNCIKPNLGMVFDVLKREKITLKNSNIYIVGDRISDIETAIRAKGTGVFIPFKNEINQEKLIKKNHPSIKISKNFLYASKFIYNRERK